MIKEHEQKLLLGGKEFGEKEKKELKRYNELKSKYQKERQEQKEFLKKHAIENDNVSIVNRQYENIKEKLEDKNKYLRELNERYKSNITEIKDLKKENQDQKEALLNDIREQSEDITFYQKLVEIIYSKEEIERIQEKSRWDEEMDIWRIPNFFMQYNQDDLWDLPKVSRASEPCKRGFDDPFNNGFEPIAQEQKMHIDRKSVV